MAPPKEQQACAADINRWLTEGRLKPKIDRILALSETATAHRLQEEHTIGKTGNLGGKIVLKP
jgi:NADPH2:quinone reductase